MSFHHGDAEDAEGKRDTRRKLPLVRVACIDPRLRRKIRVAVRRHGLDRRRVYVVGYRGDLATDGYVVITCSGCFEGGEYMGNAHHYPWDEKAKCQIGGGCDECGYTGKRRVYCPTPVRAEGELIKIEEGEND